MVTMSQCTRCPLACNVCVIGDVIRMRLGEFVFVLGFNDILELSWGEQGVKG